MSLSNSPFLSVLKRQKPSRKPVWFMRQAGRYLPEYREIRKQHSMLDAIQTPALAAEITLQPLRRFDLDAAIIFADILNPLIGMGMELDFVEKEGPKIFNPISAPSHVDALKHADPKKTVGYTLEAISTVVKELTPSGVPLVGFCGSPFTLSTYMIEGRTAHSLTHVKQFIAKHPESWDALQKKLSLFLVDYLTAQVEAGASAVQLFDSWAGFLSPYQYSAWALPYIKALVDELKKRISVPVLYFSTGTSGVYDQISTLPVDGVSIDWRMSLSEAARTFGDLPLQGNLDPEILPLSQDVLGAELGKVLESSRGVKHHIFNLGHGILPHTPPENVAFVTKTVHAHTL